MCLTLSASSSHTYTQNYSGKGATEYYAIAVVKATQDMSKGWESLRGLKSCHTGYRKTSGWTVPIGTLISTGVMSYEGNTDPDMPNDIYAVKNFFTGGSCAPSQVNPPQNDKTGICNNCPGTCTWTASEPYQDYKGEFVSLHSLLLDYILQ